MPVATELTERLVRYERRIELAFEGLRYFDLKRWDLGNELLNGIIYGCRNGSVDSNTGKVTWGDGYIKLEERIFNPEIGVIAIQLQNLCKIHVKFIVILRPIILEIIT